MNTLRNLFSARTLTTLRQHGQNVLYNLAQPVDGASTASVAHCENDSKPSFEARPNQPLSVPKGILDATTFTGKKLGPAVAAATTTSSGSISPTTLRRYRGMERKVELVYRCKLCNTRNSKLVAETAYVSGVVILQCDGCSVNHLIIDNLGWFANTKGKSFDQVLAEKGDRVKIIKVNEHGELI